ncbi:MAG: Gfo/Idh/MocA family oxidoreductase [Verrucomicrobia bacterium]|nr:Gfo/Idh/MocA family oxidoreductase [Verrucomicrobiota bacterium]
MNDKPVKLAFVGLKGINLWHYLPGVRATAKAELVGGVDISQDAQDVFREKSGRPAYGSLNDLLAAQRVEAILIGTPNPIHLANICEAAQAGLHVSVTKPLCNTVRECQEALRVCASHKRILQVSHEYRFRPSIRKAIAIARAGELGALSLVTAHIGSNGGIAGLTATGSWRSKAENVPGGCLNLLGVHMLDVLNAILGRPVRVMANLAKLLTQSEIEDTAAVTVEYKSGNIGVLTSSYASAHSDYLHVFGTEANLVATEKTLHREARREAVPITDMPTVGSAQVVVEQFCDAIRSGKAMDTAGEAGLLAVAMYEAAVLSSRECRGVLLNEALFP